jgi:hypothetical protein
MGEDVMDQRGGSYARWLAAGNLLAGLVMVVGGLLEAAATIRFRGPMDVYVVLGVFGGLAGLCFLASAAALWKGRDSARRITLGAAAAALVVHATGVLLAQPGLPVVAVGVVYPAAVLLLSWLNPRLGSGVSVVQPRREPRSGTDGSSRFVSAIA